MNASPLSASISAARDAVGVALLPFVAAGFPSLDATVATIDSLAELPGVGAIEVGFPFSDPVADGPVIQEAFNVALEAGTKVESIFAAIARTKAAGRKPLVAMVSFSIVHRYGVERFLKDAKSAGFSGMLLPDLPLPEGQKTCDLIAAAGLETVLLVAPTTSARRRAEIGRMATGFVYYLSVSGITGERDALPADLEANVRAIRGVAKAPTCIGFGISKPEHMRRLKGIGDGAIVGSAIVRRMREHAAQGPTAVAQAVSDYCRTLTATA